MQESVMLIQKNGVMPKVLGRPVSGGQSLRKWRQWFDGEDADGDPPAPLDDGGKYNPSNLDDALKIIGALEKRIGERDATKSELEARLAAIEAAQRKKLEQEGNYEELLKQAKAEAESLKPVAERAKALEDVIRASNDARIERLPETVRGIVPTDYAPEKLQDWLNRSEGFLTKPPAPDYDAGAGGGSKKPVVEVTDADRAAAKHAQSQGYTSVTPEAIAKRRLGITD